MGRTRDPESKAGQIRFLASRGADPKEIARVIGVTRNFVLVVLWKARNADRVAAYERERRKAQEWRPGI